MVCSHAGEGPRSGLAPCRCGLTVGQIACEALRSSVWMFHQRFSHSCFVMCERSLVSLSLVAIEALHNQEI